MLSMMLVCAAAPLGLSWFCNTVNPSLKHAVSPSDRKENNYFS